MREMKNNLNPINVKVLKMHIHRNFHSKHIEKKEKKTLRLAVVGAAAAAAFLIRSKILFWSIQ